jgi:hypothetical protein
MNRRLAASVIALAIVAGMASPAAATAAPAATGTITVMLMTPPKEKLPLVNAGIVMTNEFGVTRTGLTNLEGQLTLQNVPVGSRWSIAATPQLVAGRWQQLPGIRWGVTVTEGRHDWVAVVIRYGGSIGGGVTSADGAARNAAVTAVGGWSNKTYRTWTNNSGRYELGGLPTGEYTVTYRLGTRSATISGVHIDAQYDSLPWSVLTGVDARVE